jgi:hypothetical protein
MKLGSFAYPAEPTLDESESLVAMFEGLRARVTLTDKRIIVSRFGHTSIPYEDVVDVDGGWDAGPNYAHLRDNASIAGGIYILMVDWHEEWVHVPRAKEAAELIRTRASNLWPGSTENGLMSDWVKGVQRERSLRPPSP